jgi:DNA-binding Lrp family transcriptional regulator
MTMRGTPKLDRIDVNILAQLQRHGRMSNVDLAEAVALSPSPCLQRVKRLEAAGYIAGYGAHISLAKLGTTVTVFTQVTLADHRLADFVRFESSLRNVDEVIECHLVSGGYDYLIKFVAKSITHYQSVIEELLKHDVGISQYFSFIVIRSPLIRLEYPLKSLLDRTE